MQGVEAQSEVLETAQESPVKLGQVVATVNQKGGVGKTTTSLNLGYVLARELGRSVLLVDLDPQCSLTQGVGLEDTEAGESMAGVLTEEVSLGEVLVGVELPVGSQGSLDIAPSHQSLRSIENRLVGEMGTDALLADALGSVKDEYDFVIVDCRPALGLLEANALSAANWVLIPILAEPYALYATNELLEFVDLARKRLNPELKLLGVLPTRVDRRNKVCVEVLAETKQFFGDDLFEHEIRINTHLAEVPGRGVSVFDYAPSSRGAHDYRSLGKEVLNRVGE